MALYFRCQSCRADNSAANSVCHKCGKRLSIYGRSYFTRFRTAGGTHVKKNLRASTLEEAMAREKLLVEESKQEFNEPPPPMTWKDVRYAYEHKLATEKRSKVYQNATCRYLRIMGEVWGDNISLEEVTVEMVQSFFLSLRTKGDSIYSVNRYHAAGRAAYSHFLPGRPNPFHLVRTYNERDRMETHDLSDDEVGRILDAARMISRQLYEMLHVWLRTGLRKTNCLHLKRSEVDFRQGTITVRQKGDRPHTVDVGEEILELLKAIPENGTDYFWINHKTGGPYHQDWRKPFKRALELAGITRRVRFHDLRHTVGALVYEETGDIMAVKTVLGHRQLSTTERYVRPRGERRKAIAKKLDTMFPINVPQGKKPK